MGNLFNLLNITRVVKGNQIHGYQDMNSQYSFNLWERSLVRL